MKTKQKTYTVIYELDATTGWWAVSVKEVPGCFTQGKTLAHCRKRIREALSLSVDNAYKAELLDEIVLPQEACEILDNVEKVQERQREAQLDVQKTTAEAAYFLNKECKCGMRDIGELMGLSHQRIGQLTKMIEE
jgi:predicted RNase H-like HicB family nuclease